MNRKITENTKKTMSNKLRNITAMSTLIIAVVVAFSAQIFFAAQVATTGQNISVLENRKLELEDKMEVLREEIVALSAMPKIEKQAREEFSMDRSFSHLVFISETPDERSIATR
ncbi:hypothetical protein GW793_02415 [bacterium]|uniref:Cell division protein FtsL n=1 Tax=candidate division WWE3 bacterium CG22_combo_CG10-13_8_21_14_all_39_12 TaxID=1975094 RepID=A0A2H0BFP9_UNCKA|nr:hypothetical protein [bacterium]PIP56399.1 MAG: hypothetical protein COX05_03270 [candidate division WWE3 bacterium CG22_combo_CG10-13_8_21_14_all_39_12]